MLSEIPIEIVIVGSICLTGTVWFALACFYKWIVLTGRTEKYYARSDMPPVYFKEQGKTYRSAHRTKKKRR